MSPSQYSFLLKLLAYGSKHSEVQRYKVTARALVKKGWITSSHRITPTGRTALEVEAGKRARATAQRIVP